GADPVKEACVRRVEASHCRAIVVTLATTMLAGRPRNLDLAYLPFLHGRGIAQYTGDPAFRARLAEPLDGEPGAPAGRITWAAVKAFFGAARRYPGTLLTNLRSGQPRAAVRRFAATFPRPSLSWEDIPRL